MLRTLREQMMRAVEQRLDDGIMARIDQLKEQLGGRPTDDFGFDPDQLKFAAPVIDWLYRTYFRVEAHGLDQLPDGQALYISNHSGQLPFDGIMIGTALLLEAEPPRAVRSMIERWVPELPFVSELFARLGAIVGTPENCVRLLEQGHSVLVFPEGVRGVGKTFDKAYQLQEFGHGFMRLALQTGTPIVPVGVVGAEEQQPALFKLDALGKAIGAPPVPITPTFPLLGPAGLLPLPVRYRIYFGRPVRFEGDPDDDDAVIGAKVDEVRRHIDALLQKGLAEREHVFW